MPSLQFHITALGYNTKNEYEFLPSDFEMFPKINPLYKNTNCDLGLFSLEFESPGSNFYQADSFALGQVFILKYGLTYKVTQSSEGAIMTFFSNPG